MRLPRWCHRLYAWAFGYFWLPCPACGDPFGGHEWTPADIEVRPLNAPLLTLCPACTKATARRLPANLH